MINSSIIIKIAILSASNFIFLITGIAENILYMLFGKKSHKFSDFTKKFHIANKNIYK